MRPYVLAFAAASLVPVCPETLAARQTEPNAPASQGAYERHRHDFDYLLGDWAFEATGLEWGTFRGTWSAVRLPGGQVLDVYRTLGDDGSVSYQTTTLRAFNTGTMSWDLVGMDAGNGLRDFGTARRQEGELHLEQRIGEDIWRIRYYNITGDSFSWVADVSADNGTTWAKGFLRIEARRTGPPREWNLLELR